MQLLDFKVRSSSDKEDISLNRKLCITVLHKNPEYVQQSTEDIEQSKLLQPSTVYFWCDIAKMKDHLQKVCDTKSEKLDAIDDDTFVFRCDYLDSTGLLKFVMQKMIIEFSDY